MPQRESQSYGPVLLQTSFRRELIIVRKTCDYVNATTATTVNCTSATVCEIPGDVSICHFLPVRPGLRRLPVLFRDGALLHQLNLVPVCDFLSSSPVGHSGLVRTTALLVNSNKAKHYQKNVGSWRETDSVNFVRFKSQFVIQSMKHEEVLKQIIFGVCNNKDEW